MPGFFYQSLRYYFRPEPQVGFLPTNKKYQGNYKYSSLYKCLDKFLSLQKIFIVASSNGFILCSLTDEDPVNYYVVNPVTLEYVALPELYRAALPAPKPIRSCAVGFVCKGDYPSLDFVEYTIVIISFRQVFKINHRYPELLFKFLSSGDNQWREYRYSCMSLNMTRHHNPVIVRSTATNSDDDQGGGGGGGIVVYFLAILDTTNSSGIVVLDLNKAKANGDNNLLQMIQPPGTEISGRICNDYIREFDDGVVIHYVRIISCSMDFEFWVLKTETRDWCLKHKANLKMMIMKGFLWTEDLFVHGLSRPYHIHDFHPMNPNLIFLTLYGRMVCYNLQTEELELVYDFAQQNMLEDYYHYVYQWPCWPPLF